MNKVVLFFLAIICASCIPTMTTAEWMFGIIKKALALTIGTEFFYTVGIGDLALDDLNSVRSLIAQSLHYELRHRVGVIEEAARNIVLTHSIIIWKIWRQTNDL